MTMDRRGFLAGLFSLGAAAANAKEVFGPVVLQTGAATSFLPGHVDDLAQRMAKHAYVPPPTVPDAWTKLSYDDYRKIVFDTRKALWAGENETPLRLDVFPPGLYFPKPVRVSVVEDGKSRPVLFDLGVFHNVDELPDLPHGETLGYSGLRLRSELRNIGEYEEFAVFQGASYFRAIGTGLTYGLSARGLAIDTAEPHGEEFPDFTAFWVEKPDPEQASVVVHALLDSPRCTGAYHFSIRPGRQLVMDVSATVFPRDDLAHVGLGALTSMFLFDQTNRHRFDDFRPAVHDNDGLLIVNGAGETLWRPLANPKTLQISAFVDDGPQGFGLMQRARTFGDFADLEALYHNRPGLWVEPGEDWGKGAVTLVEIPTGREIYDNIVAYWRPDDGLRNGVEHKFTYRLTWAAESDQGTGLRVLNTAIGRRQSGGIIVVIDFEGDAAVPADLGAVTRLIRTNAGEVSEGVLQRNPETGGPRLAFSFDPMGAHMAEFRAQLRMDGAPLSEVWLYRWTA